MLRPRFEHKFQPGIQIFEARPWRNHDPQFSDENDAVQSFVTHDIN